MSLTVSQQSVVHQFSLTYKAAIKWCTNGSVMLGDLKITTDIFDEKILCDAGTSQASGKDKLMKQWFLSVAMVALEYQYCHIYKCGESPNHL